MRFLHTADWHVGRTIRGRSRLDEFESALGAVVEIARDQAVDCVLVAGDIYDQRSVSPDVDRLIFDTLIALHSAGIPVVAIPGNHDSAPRMAAFAPLLDHVGTRLAARVRHPDKGGMVEIGSRDGSETALIACVPFVSPRRFSDAAGLFSDAALGFVNFDESMGIMLATFEQAFRKDAVNLVLGHLFVAGSQPSGSEREVTVGSDYAVSAARLPTTASYIALGHIHKPQKVRGAAAETRYSGSLLQLDFGERGQDKAVTIVDVHPGKPPKSEQIPFSAGKQLIEIDTTIEDLAAVAETVGDAYLRVNLSVDAPASGLADKVRDLLPNALDIRLLLPETERIEEETRSLRDLDPRNQFASYYDSVHGAQPSKELLDAFDRVYEEVTA